MKLTKRQIDDVLAESFDAFDEAAFDESRQDIVELVPLPVIRFLQDDWEEDEYAVELESGNVYPLSLTAAQVWSQAIDQAYWRAMSRHESYHGNVAGHIWYEDTVVYRDGDGLGWLVGSFRGPVFFASHFAPRGAGNRQLRNGARMLAKLANSEHPIVLCPKTWMQGQLTRLGWTCVGHVPQWFAGEWEEKAVMVNRGANNAEVVRIMAEFAGELSE